MEKRTSYEIISSYVTAPIRLAMLKVKEEKRIRLSEIRIRSGRAVSFVYPDSIWFLTSGGDLVKNHLSNNCIIASPSDIKAMVEALCRYSMHSCSRELREGYFVIGQGVRVGAAGTFSETESRIIRDFSSLNFRISRCVQGCAEEIFRRTCLNGRSILICGGVNSGKTTLLRDLCRLCGNNFKVVLIDERNEISSTAGGVPDNDIGAMTDVIVGSKRDEGILSAIRTLSPDMIVCDEISGENDTAAILNGFGCGVRFAASLHADSYEDMLRRTVARPLISAGVFDYAVFLEGSSFPSKIREIRRLKNAS